jgi:hypothetical protein
MTHSQVWARFQRHAEFCDSLWREIRQLHPSDPRSLALVERACIGAEHLCWLYGLLQEAEGRTSDADFVVKKPSAEP